MKYRILLIVLTFMVLLASQASCRQSQPLADAEVNADSALAQCHRQIDRALAQLSASGMIDTSVMPRNVAPGDTAWSCRPVCAEEWCSGFWPGILWMDYEARQLQGATAEATSRVRRAALDATAAMQRIVDAPVFDHDLGFLLFCSAGTGLRVLEKELAREDLPADVRAEDEAAATLYRDFCLRAADSLATLFRPRVGTILSWPRNVGMFGGHNTIMDNMINLELLFWASEEREEKGGSGQRLWDMAVSHAATTMRHHTREDGSGYHVAVYDTLTGRFLKGVTHQGYADSSMWARGQGWAIYGFTLVYRFTREQRFLDFVQKVTDIYLRRLAESSDDWVPLWDFDDPRGPQAPKDASAACVVASALLELQDYVGPEKQKTYLHAARQMLSSLASDAYQASPQNPAFLLHSTGNHPAGSEIDVPIVYADYYYIEALLRLRQLSASAVSSVWQADRGDGR